MYQLVLCTSSRSWNFFLMWAVFNFSFFFFRNLLFSPGDVISDPETFAELALPHPLFHCSYKFFFLFSSWNFSSSNSILLVLQLAMCKTCFPLLSNAYVIFISWECNIQSFIIKLSLVTDRRRNEIVCWSWKSR